MGCLISLKRWIPLLVKSTKNIFEVKENHQLLGMEFKGLASVIQHINVKKPR